MTTDATNNNHHVFIKTRTRNGFIRKYRAPLDPSRNTSTTLNKQRRRHNDRAPPASQPAIVLRLNVQEPRQNKTRSTAECTLTAICYPWTKLTVFRSTSELTSVKSPQQ